MLYLCNSYILFLIFFSINILPKNAIASLKDLGKGYDTQRLTIKKSPFKNIELVYGTPIADLEFKYEYMDSVRTKDVLVTGGAELGTPVLGAELVGSINLKKVDLRKLFSMKMCRNTVQTARVDDYELNDSLASIRTFNWKSPNFKKVYGDSLIWSADYGAYFCATIFAKYKYSHESKDIDIAVKIKALFAKFTIYNQRKNWQETGADEFEYSVYLSQEGGKQRWFREFANQVKDSSGEFEDLLIAMEKIYDYAFSQQQGSFSTQWDHKTLLSPFKTKSYSNKEFRYL